MPLLTLSPALRVLAPASLMQLTTAYRAAWTWETIDKPLSALDIHCRIRGRFMRTKRTYSTCNTFTNSKLFIPTRTNKILFPNIRTQILNYKIESKLKYINLIILHAMLSYIWLLQCYFVLNAPKWNNKNIIIQK